MMKPAVALFVAAALLAGCGGDDNFSWCYGSNDGHVQASYNSSCPDGEAQRPSTAKDDAQDADELQQDE